MGPHHTSGAQRAANVQIPEDDAGRAGSAAGLSAVLAQAQKPRRGVNGAVITEYGDEWLDKVGKRPAPEAAPEAAIAPASAAALSPILEQVDAETAAGHIRLTDVAGKVIKDWIA